MKKRMTKREVSKVLAVVMVISMLLSTPVFAAESKTVEVKGYISEGMSEEDIANVDPHFSVSNVIDTFDTNEIDPEINAGLIVESPATIKLLVDNGVIFDVFKLKKKDDTTYEYDYDKALEMSGQVKIYAPDESGALDESGNPKYIEKTIEASELKNYEVEFPQYLSGCSVTLTEPGDYYVLFRYEAVAGAAQAIITVKGTEEESDSTTEDVKEESDTTVEDVKEEADTTVEDEKEESDTTILKAQPTASKVLVNGTETSFEAYMIDGNNYFKLRDLAKVVSGTEKQFEVTWDGDKKAINLISNKAYTPVGGEMASGDGAEKTPVLNTSKIYKDGQEITLKAYTINENNFFKLRDIAKAFDIGITWDSETSTVGIDTSIGYVEE